MPFNRKINNLIQKREGQCKCVSPEDQFNKETPGSSSPSIKLTKNQMTAQIIKHSRGGGRVAFGSGTPLSLNYLGQIEGMPGGTLPPPRNFY